MNDKTKDRNDPFAKFDRAMKRKGYEKARLGEPSGERREPRRWKPRNQRRGA